MLCDLKGEYRSPSMCRFKVIAMAANSWLNVVTTYQIHNVLIDCKIGIRHVPTKHGKVYFRSFMADH